MAEATPIEDLVAGLGALHDLEAAKSRLLAAGQTAVPALRRFLCQGTPEVIFEPSRAAVEVLASFGAKDVLLEYLRQPPATRDPVARLAEEAIESAAARALARWPIPEVYQVLLEAAARGPRAGVLEALSAFPRPESMPYFLDALEDGLCESAAVAALRRRGREAEWPLLSAVRSPRQVAGREPATSLRRRRRALELLAELGPSPEVWTWLRPLLADPDPGLALGAAKIAAQGADPADQAAAVERLLALLPVADWYDQGEIRTCLDRVYSIAAPRIAREIAARAAAPLLRRAADSALRLLLALRQQHQPPARRRA